MSRSPVISCNVHPNTPLIQGNHVGTMICPDCGLVVGDRVVDVGSEWQTFNNSNNDPSRVGAHENPLLENDLTTTIGKSTGTEYHNQNTMGSTNRTLLSTFREINQFADKVNLPGIITNEAAGMFMQEQSGARRSIESAWTGWIDGSLRPLFSVDDTYVIKKLGFIMFPFAHRRWHGNNELPKDNLVQPDLYIPLMSFMTYVLAAGYFLGFKGKFSPEQLGITSSSALICLTLEVGLMVVLFNICNVKTWYSFLHYVAFCGYKFVPIITAMLASLLFKNAGYYATIGYTTLSLGYYFMKSFHVAIESSNHENYDRRVTKLGIYIVGLFCLFQPLFMVWLSYHLVP